ncbi:UDP-3-O-(3-hydroxymyristoyl)glucosamine N-acyltransferase [Austwickia sp. TVS 96-490-7B]|uniref:serine O-acetyltransferase n=1 Tax=Austwickia sp. TVS 96-490-7B TaxID=2830843 RepID=UPI001C59687D|nr:hypothetical protein [Austwickia sp. TVS 96-490-7B]MBW3084583.1 UDP-3-O-(3-hydroxymyristoyl)glucosamine N-acyltransferase [Austwickia sp. TVS 96-490-7B]
MLTRILEPATRDSLGRKKTASVRAGWAEAKALLKVDFTKSPALTQRVTLTTWRLGQAFCGRPGLGPFLVRRAVQVMDAVWVRTVMGAELPPQVVCGPGVRFPHAGRGVIIHNTAVIGSNAVIYHRVTIGMSWTLPAPRIGNDVFIGTGANILGTINVADGTWIGANAVVVKDTLPHHTYVGVPAIGRPRESQRTH